MVVDVPVVVRRQVPEMVQTVQTTVEVPQLQFSCVWSSSVTRLLTCPLLFNDRCVVATVRETVGAPQLQCFDKVNIVPVVLVQTVQPVETAQVGLLDAGHRQGVDVAVSMQRQGSSCPHRQLRFLSLVHRHGRDELRWFFFFFLKPCTQVQDWRGHVHRDMAAMIRCIYWRVWTNTLVKSHVKTTTTTTTRRFTRE